VETRRPPRDLFDDDRFEEDTAKIFVSALADSEAPRDDARDADLPRASEGTAGTKDTR
jgi:hypothetical protein